MRREEARASRAGNPTDHTANAASYIKKATGVGFIIEKKPHARGTNGRINRADLLWRPIPFTELHRRKSGLLR